MNNISLFFSALRWQDVVDIILNSYILFRFYVLFRGTQVFRVIFGLVILWFLQKVAVYVGLIITSWAIQGIIAVAAFIIIVVFRNEIRSALQAQNLKSILWGSIQQTDPTILEIISESVLQLAQKGIGALIVLPGKEDIDDLVQNGIFWGARASREMILSVFWPENPVHDGAAIVEANRVSKVGVILPLSHREDLPSHFGTRHRAAIGLAEASDAAVIVVSEERREIIVAKHDLYKGIATKEMLVRTLKEHLGIRDDAPEVRKKDRLSVGIAAAVCVLLVTGIWFSFTRGLERLITLEVPIEYMNRDPGMEIVQVSTNEVRLQLSGSGSLIKSIQPDQIRVRLNLEKAIAGQNSFPITGKNISLPPGILFSAAFPPSVEMTLDAPVSRRFPLQIDWIGKLSDGLIMEKAVIEPKTVKVTGGSQVLIGISTIYTEPLRLENIRNSGFQWVGLAMPGSGLKTDLGVREKVKVSYWVTQRGRGEN